MKNIIALLLVSIFLFIQCSQPDFEDNITYYKFTNEDNQFIINYDYDVNDIIIYQNQFGEQIHCKVVYNETKRRGKYQGSFAGFGDPTLQYYYDGKIIRLEIVENITDTNLSSNNRELINYIFLKGSDSLISGLNFPMWNVSNSSHLVEGQNSISFGLWDYYDTQRQEMNVNGHLFNNVIVINSESNLPLNSNLLPNNVNEIFYDFDFGIIQFNDIEDKQWKLIYPN